MRTKVFSIVFVIIAFALSVTAQSQQAKPQDKILKSEKFQREVAAFQMEYLTFLPKSYDAKSDKKWPLILFLHGAGERGTNVWRVNIHGPSKYILENPDFPFIFISPLCSSNEIWSSDRLMALLDEVEKKHKVDSSRIYLTGLSMGGYGTWELGTTYPERFAAIAPICGGGMMIRPLLAARGYDPKKSAAFQTLAVWAFHGAKDTVVPASESEHMLEAMKLAKVPEIKYTLYPEKQHDSWTETYNNPELYDWFLEHKRESAPISR